MQNSRINRSARSINNATSGIMKLFYVAYCTNQTTILDIRYMIWRKFAAFPDKLQAKTTLIETREQFDSDICNISQNLNVDPVQASRPHSSLRIIPYGKIIPYQKYKIDDKSKNIFQKNVLKN